MVPGLSASIATPAATRPVYGEPHTLPNDADCSSASAPIGAGRPMSRACPISEGVTHDPLVRIGAERLDHREGRTLQAVGGSMPPADAPHVACVPVTPYSGICSPRSSHCALRTRRRRRRGRGGIGSGSSAGPRAALQVSGRARPVGIGLERFGECAALDFFRQVLARVSQSLFCFEILLRKDAARARNPLGGGTGFTPIAAFCPGLQIGVDDMLEPEI